MTREEAIKIIETAKKFAYDECYEKAFDMAIKALEQEPILEKDGTLIVTTEHYYNVSRVLVQYGMSGSLFYQDQEPTTKNDCAEQNGCISCSLDDGDCCRKLYEESMQELTTKNDLDHNLCDLCTNIGCEFQSGIVRTKCAFYMPPHIEPDNCGNYVVQDSTTKHDLGVDCISRIEVIDYLCKHCPDDGECFKDCDEIKHLRNIPSVTPQEQTTKNDLEVDCISRKAVERIINKWLSHSDYELKDHIYSMTEKIHNLPSVTPQEPFKPMVEIDLDYVIKQKYIEREVLDKIRAEIETIIGENSLDDYDFCSGLICARKIIDKYKAESEG